LGREEVCRGVFNRNIKETVAIGEIKDDILGAMVAMGEAELATNTVDFGNGGMASAVKRFTARIRGEDSGLE
jgi:hypothetical protein